MAALILALGLNTVALATCHPDAELAKIQQGMAKRNFPALLPALPSILGCDSRADMPGAVGDFDPDKWQIRVLRQRRSVPVEIIVAHELGHALASKNGEVYGRFKGHGPIWIATMIRAGYGLEAYRTAELTNDYPGLMAVYQKVAQSEMPQRPPQPQPQPDTELDVFALLRERPTWLQWLSQPID